MTAPVDIEEGLRLLAAEDVAFADLTVLAKAGLVSVEDAAPISRPWLDAMTAKSEWVTDNLPALLAQVKEMREALGDAEQGMAYAAAHDFKLDAVERADFVRRQVAARQALGGGE